MKIILDMLLQHACFTIVSECCWLPAMHQIFGEYLGEYLGTMPPPPPFEPTLIL